MKLPLLLLPLLLLALPPFACANSPEEISDTTVQETFNGKKGAFVLIQCSTGKVSDATPQTSQEALPPCSTFKVWNAIFGLEEGLISDPAETFYKWDGVERSIKPWNQDLTLRAAFQASCVPAFQDLARKIGEARMNQWIKKTRYGDENTSAGIDAFWLPAEGRQAIMISAMEQAELLCQLVNGKLPVAAESVAKLKVLMEVRKTDKGVLYGKTGSRSSSAGGYNLGWFVGFVESAGETYAFACNMDAENTSGLDARKASESILSSLKLL